MMLTSGKCQLDTHFLTRSNYAFYIDGDVEIVGNSTDGKPVSLPVKLHQRKRA